MGTNELTYPDATGLEVTEISGAEVRMSAGVLAVTKPATVKQILVRMNSGHLNALKAVRDGKELTWRTHGEYRGWRTVMHTLRGWGLIDTAALTEKGREVLVIRESQ